MSLAIPDRSDTSVMSGPEFRAFQNTRSDEERWELVAGVPIMMTPPTYDHNRIGSNFENLLNEALELYRPDLTAFQRSGIEIGSETYKPEPDVCIVDATYPRGQRYADRIYLLGEVISRSDRIAVPGKPARWIDVKREIYRSHDACEAVVLIEQDRFDIIIDTRTTDGWATVHITEPAAAVSLPMFGLHCTLRDLYKRTELYRQTTS